MSSNGKRALSEDELRDAVELTNISVSEETDCSANVQARLVPQVATGLASLRVVFLVRPKQAYTEMMRKRQEVSQEMTKKRMEHNMNRAKEMAKQQQDPKQAHETFVQFQQGVIEPLNQKMHELEKEYAENSASIMGVKNTEGQKFYPDNGWFVFTCGDATRGTGNDDDENENDNENENENENENDIPTKFIPANFQDAENLQKSYGFAVEGKESIKAELSGLPPNLQLETSCILVASNQELDNKQDLATEGEGEDGETNSNRYQILPGKIMPKSFWTKAAEWQMVLERNGLRNLIPVFEKAGLTTPKQWAELSQDKIDELGIDPASLSQLQSAIISLGVITQAESERIAREDKEIEVLVEELLQGSLEELKQKTIGLGDPVLSTTSSVLTKQKGSFGVVTRSMDERQTVNVRWGADPDAPVEENVPVKALALTHWDIFLSHAQHEAQNQVGHLSVLLREKKLRPWYDMDAERLEAKDMVRGIRNSKVFLLFLTKSYFSRWFCRLEAAVAKKLSDAGKVKLVVVYEPDRRHGGESSFTKLADESTKKRGHGSWKEFVLSTEAIPMARRVYQRRAVVDEIVKRAALTPSADAGTSSASSSSSSKRASIFGMSQSSNATNNTEALQRQVTDLQMELNDVKQDNEALWAAVRELQSQVANKHQ